MICQTIAFNEEKKKILRRELEINIAAADCPYIVKFFGAFFVEVGISQLSPDLPKLFIAFVRKVPNSVTQPNDSIGNVFSIIPQIDVPGLMRPNFTILNLGTHSKRVH